MSETFTKERAQLLRAEVAACEAGTGRGQYVPDHYTELRELLALLDAPNPETPVANDPFTRYGRCFDCGNLREDDHSDGCEVPAHSRPETTRAQVAHTHMYCDGTGFVEGVGRCQGCGGTGIEPEHPPLIPLAGPQDSASSNALKQFMENWDGGVGQLETQEAHARKDPQFLALDKLIQK